MPWTVTTDDPSAETRRYLRHWADRGFVEAQLGERHSGLSRERRRTKARQIAGFVDQGLAFLENADASPLLTRPLTLFYGVENLCKAASICVDPQLLAEDLASHGLSGERQRTRNSIANLRCRLNRPRRDVFSHTVRYFNHDRIAVGVRPPEQGEQLHDLVNRLPVSPWRDGLTLGFGPLARHLPELVDDVENAGWQGSFMVKTESLRIENRPGPPPETTVTFRLRHGHRQAIGDLIRARQGSVLRGYERLADRHDTIDFRRTVPRTQIFIPDARYDIFSNLYLDLSMTRRKLGALPLYLAALFILSDVVRYRAEHWLRLLENHRSEQLLVERFLDVAARRVPNLILTELHSRLFEFKLA